MKKGKKRARKWKKMDEEGGGGGGGRATQFETKSRNN